MVTSSPSRSTGRTAVRRPHQWLALVVALFFLVLGIVGFAVTGLEGFTEHDDSQTLLGFAINPLHNVVHLAIGLVGLALWSAPQRARVFGWVLFVGYGATFLYGLMVDTDSESNVLNLNAADNVLHVVSAVLGLVIALWPRGDADRRTVTT